MDRKRYYNWEAIMHPGFLNWHYNAKNRLVGRNAPHSVTGDVDYIFEVDGWKGRTVYGTITLLVPSGPYTTLGGRKGNFDKEFTADQLLEEAKAAVKFEFTDMGQLFNRLVQKARVTHMYKRRR